MQQAKQRKVVTGDIAQCLIVLHIGGASEDLGHQREIDAKAAREVHQAAITRRVGICKPGGQTGLVAPCKLAGALFHVEMGRIDHSITHSPRRQLTTGSLPTTDLVECPRQVHIGMFVARKSQEIYIIVAMVAYKQEGCFVLHGNLCLFPKTANTAILYAKVGKTIKLKNKSIPSFS